MNWAPKSAGVPGRNAVAGRHVIPGMAPHPTRTALSTVSTLALLLTLAGCGSQDAPVDGPGGQPPASTAEPPPAEEGDAATWVPDDDALIDPATTVFLAGVTRLGCAGGETGEVLEPQVVYEQDRVLVRTDVAPIGPGDATCQGNDTVPVEVYLDEPLGMRALVDAACVEGEAEGTAACVEVPGLVTRSPAGSTGVRWAPPAGLELADGAPDWVPPEDYSFTVQSSCGEQAFIGEYAVTVRGGEVIAVEALRRGWREIPLEAVPGLAQMLDLARDAADRGDAEVWVDSDGVPRWLWLDPLPEAVDDENCFLVTRYDAD